VGISYPTSNEVNVLNIADTHWLKLKQPWWGQQK